MTHTNLAASAYRARLLTVNKCPSCAESFIGPSPDPGYPDPCPRCERVLAQMECISVKAAKVLIAEARIKEKRT